jgi:hypothetical protein
MKPLSKLSHGETKGSVTGSFYQFQNGKRTAQAAALARATSRVSAEARQWLHSLCKGRGTNANLQGYTGFAEGMPTPMLGYPDWEIVLILQL